MLMYNLIECSKKYSRTSKSLYLFLRDEPKNTITDSESFKFKSRLLVNTNNASIANVELEIAV